MPTITTDEQGREITVYSAEEKAQGLTKDRLLNSISRVRLGGQPWADDAAYAAHVCASAGLIELPDYALSSYAEQHAARSIAELEQELADAIETAQDAGAPDLPAPVVGGVPTRVPRRKAKTIMELTPATGHANLWEAALAAAEAIPDNTQRIVKRNYIKESLYFETSTVKALAASLMGLTSEQVDQMMVAANQLPD
jgi:hypothetical protein